ncbi:hypothetical protein Dsin_011869 [Dipteronia sinensis]|uniref:Uncharacterized protein n=1 Tax=Dipteronia sinensis TaxID=43782 RepID=A0AAE0E7M6_9ROSI|nr:hypothetical protein Dsin_011869 [Dipteronia sinensis]
MVEPQFDYVFGCRIEMYNDIYNELNTEPNVGPNQEVDNEANIHLVIPGTNSYSFRIGRSSTLVAEETRIMIYKGQFFPTKKDLKRLVGLFAMRQNFEWKVKRSNKTMLHLVCLIDNYTWNLRAVRRDEDMYF